GPAGTSRITAVRASPRTARPPNPRASRRPKPNRRRKTSPPKRKKRTASPPAPDPTPRRLTRFSSPFLIFLPSLAQYMLSASLRSHPALPKFLKSVSVAALVLSLAAPGVARAEKLRVSNCYVGGAIMPLWVTQESGLFQREGLDVELITIQ